MLHGFLHGNLSWNVFIFSIFYSSIFSTISCVYWHFYSSFFWIFPIDDPQLLVFRTTFNSTILFCGMSKNDLLMDNLSLRHATPPRNTHNIQPVVLGLEAMMEFYRCSNLDLTIPGKTPFPSSPHTQFLNTCLLFSLVSLSSLSLSLLESLATSLPFSPYSFLFLSLFVIITFPSPLSTTPSWYKQ